MIIIEDKNKLKIKTKSKILVLGLILIALVGFFGWAEKVNAEDEYGKCTIHTPTDGDIVSPDLHERSCENRSELLNAAYDWERNEPGGLRTGGPAIEPPGTPGASTTSRDGASPLEQELDKACGVILEGSIGGCLAYVFYYLLYALPAFLLSVAARFFDIVVALALSSTLYSGSFISEAWEVVRDLSNIFFILILLYIAVKTILGIGGSEIKKMISRVIIMALLINFSLFFTNVIIDSSNILALVFYNKIDVTVENKGTREEINYVSTINPVLGVQDKDLAGSLMHSFDPTKLLSAEFFDTIRTKTYEFNVYSLAAYAGSGALIGSWIPIVGTAVGGVVGVVGYFLSSGQEQIPIPLLLGIITVSGGILIFATYAFFIAGLAFLSRLIELWVLIIFSPFAFMSSTIPILEKVPYIGWEEWFKRLLKVSFMAPIFLFFMYLIAKIVETNPIGALADRTPAQQGWMETMLLLIIPAIIILVLLMKATEFAKKSSGQLGEVLLKGAKVAGGLALGGGLGLAAATGRGIIGGVGGAAANKLASGANSIGLRKLGRGFKSASILAQKSSFDVRGIKGVQGLAGSAGIKLGEAKQGGIEQSRKDKVDKMQKRATQLGVGEDEKLKQEVNRAEQDLQELANQTAKTFEQIDRDLETQRKKKSDATSGSLEEADAVRAIKTLRNEKEDFEENTKVKGGKNDGKSMKEMRKEVIPDAKNAVLKETRDRIKAYADSITGNWFTKLVLPGVVGGKANREAAHKIRTEAEIKEKAA